MSKLKKWITSPRAQIVFAAGSSILIIAAVTKWVIKSPIHPFLLAIPPLIEAVYEYVLKKNKDSKITTTWYWVAAILTSTALILLLTWIKN
jgi:hypothetical protein